MKMNAKSELFYGAKNIKTGTVFLIVEEAEKRLQIVHPLGHLLTQPAGHFSTPSLFPTEMFSSKQLEKAAMHERVFKDDRLEERVIERLLSAPWQIRRLGLFLCSRRELSEGVICGFRRRDLYGIAGVCGGLTFKQERYVREILTDMVAKQVFPLEEVLSLPEWH